MFFKCPHGRDLIVKFLGNCDNITYQQGMDQVFGRSVRSGQQDSRT